MADPISVVSLVAIALHSSKKVYQLIEKVKDAPRHVQEIFEDSLIVRNHLLQLKESLDDDGDIALGPENALRASLENTNGTLKSLEETIKPFLQAKNSTRKGIGWILNEDKKMNELRMKLKNSQAALAIALAISVRDKTKSISGHTQTIMSTQKLTLESLTTFGNNFEDHSNAMTDTQTAILDTVKKFGNTLEKRDTDDERENVRHNPTDLIGLSKYLESVAIARYSPPPTNAAGMSTFDEDFDDDTVPPELLIQPPPASLRHDLESKIERLLLNSSEGCLMNDEGQTALHLAAQQDAYLTQKVISHGLHFDEPNVEGETPLMSAVMVENIETAKVLLKQGADVKATNENSETPLHYAARHNKNDSITQLLLRRKANIEAVNSGGMTALYVSALQGNDVVCRYLLETGANVHALKPDGWTALHYLAMRGDPACMEPLLSQAGADVEVFYNSNHFGSQSSKAYDTSSKRKVALVGLLLDKGADINAKCRGYTALNLAVLSCQDLLVTTLLAHNASAQGTSLVCLNWGLSTENVEQLLKDGATIEARDCRHRKTALIWAAETGSLAAIKVLLDCGANVNAQDDQLLSALRYAAANARTEIVQLLLERGADPKMEDRGGKTPLVAVGWGRPFSLGGRFYNPTPMDRERTASLLMDAGAKASEKDHSGAAAIHYAAQNGYLELVKLLHCRGDCDLGSKWMGKSALDLAMEQGHRGIAKYLKRHLLLNRAEK